MQFLERLPRYLGRMSGNNLTDELVIKIIGANLPNGTATTAALDIGKNFAVARDDGSNTVTITFNQKLAAAPLIKSFVSNTADAKLDTYTSTTTTLVYLTVKASDNSALAHVDALITLLVPRQKV